MLKKKINIALLLLIGVISGCSDNSVESNETLIYERNGVIESLGGDCSAVQVRTSSLGTLDLRNIRKVKFKLMGMSDADLSSVTIYRVENGQNVFLLNLQNSEQINSTQELEIDTPGIETELFFRVTLKSSVCTGQIFRLEVRDLKIYSIR